jgi:hypothetical protein
MTATSRPNITTYGADAALAAARQQTVPADGQRANNETAL